jgi:hypothetical protein
MRGARRRGTHCQSFTRYEADYCAGTRTFSFDPAIYGDVAVKAALVAAQHKKCCFCESIVGTDGDVEHFRPKAACRQTSGDALTRPGYYWLAYDWSNLLLACGPCNQRHKGNLFPLADPSRRVTSHKDTHRLQD